MWIKRQVVMLPTKESAPNKLISDRKILTIRDNKPFRPFTNELFDLFFLSDEKIKKEEWYILLPEQQVKQAQTDLPNHRDWKKIIATTDESIDIIIPKGSDYEKKLYFPRPSQQFIEVFIREYNQGNIITDVMVEYEYIDCEGKVVPDSRIQDGGCFKLKVKPDNTITIRRVKDSWNREEHISNLLKYKSDLLVEIGRCKELGISLKKEFTDKWIEENL